MQNNKTAKRMKPKHVPMAMSEIINLRMCSLISAQKNTDQIKANDQHFLKAMRLRVIIRTTKQKEITI